MASPEAWLSSTIETAAGCPAYPLAVPEGRVPPFVVYGRSSTAREDLLDGLDDVAVGTFAVTLYVDGYLDAKGLADLIRVALNNFKGPAGDANILSVHLTDESDGDPEFLEGRDRPTFVIEHTYTIRWEE